MTQDPNNYAIPATRNNGEQRHPYTNEPRTQVGPEDVWVPNPGTSSTYPSRPAPLDRSRDPNIRNPYASSLPNAHPGISMTRAEEDRILAQASRDPSSEEMRAMGYHMTYENLAEDIMAARRRGERYTYPMANQMGVEANNYVALVSRGIPAAVADAATNNMRYPTQTHDDRIDADALQAGREAYNRTRPGTVEVNGRRIDAQMYATAVAVRSTLEHALPYQYERDPGSLTADTATLTQAVREMPRSGR